jgi:hypothetical protein
MTFVVGGKVANPIKILSVNYDSNEMALARPTALNREFIRSSEYIRSSTADSENIDLGITSAGASAGRIPSPRAGQNTESS